MSDKNDTHYDVVVIGAGPGGYVAAIRCAQLGLSTAVVDDWRDGRGEPAPGGTCLNVGCIPSKVLLESSALYEACAGGLEVHGIQSQASLDLAQMMHRKDGIVADLTQGVLGLFQANGVKLYSGRGRLLAERRVLVSDEAGAESARLSAAQVILAGGSRPRILEALPFDGERVVDSSGALAFDTVPERLAIVGAGVIGLELGSVWRRLGAQVSLFKSGQGLLPELDAQIARLAERRFKAQGLAFHYGARISGAEVGDEGVRLHYRTEQGEAQADFDKVIVAVGRVPNSEGLFDEGLPIERDEGGRIVVDAQCRTAMPGVYAVGDLVRGPMLAHKGSEEGIMVAELIAGRHGEVDYSCIPSVIYTAPEIAWCGQSEAELKAQGRAYRVGQFPFAANGRAKAGGESEGFIKVLADAGSDRVLGVHMIGPHCSELIAQAVIAMSFQASSEDLALMVFAHPTLGETLHEAAMDVGRLSIHKAHRR